MNVAYIVSERNIYSHVRTVSCEVIQHIPIEVQIYIESYEAYFMFLYSSDRVFVR